MVRRRRTATQSARNRIDKIGHVLGNDGFRSGDLQVAVEIPPKFGSDLATGRTPEIGVRPALGAERTAIVGMVVSRAMLLGGLGVELGVAGGLALTRLLRSMLYEVSATDPAVFAAVPPPLPSQ